MPQGKGTYGTKRGRPSKKRVTDTDRKRYKKVVGGVLSKFEGSRVTNVDLDKYATASAAKRKTTAKKATVKKALKPRKTTTKTRMTDADRRRRRKLKKR